MKKKLVAQALSLAIIAGTVGGAVGCGPTVLNEVDETMTQIYISAYDAGYGREWLDTFAVEFQELHKETSFEENKMGVQVFVDWNQNNASTLIGSLGSNPNDLFFNHANYYELVNSGKALNISSWLKEDLSEYGDTAGTTIESKIDDYYKNYLTSVNGHAGEYYAFPAYETYNGFTYDADVFEAYSLYFKEGGGWTGDLSEAAAGPDGKTGTYDDGLPTTYDEFFELCDQALLSSVIPVTGAEGAVKYGYMIPQALWVNEEGKDSMQLNFSFDGTAKTLVNVNADGTVTPLGDTVITDDNAYMLMKQQGIYSALQFVNRLVNGSATYGSYLSGNTFINAQDHLSAQEEYVYSNVEEVGNTPIAMLFEGSYWTMEADAAFNTAANTYDAKYARENRNFKWMPLPFASAEGKNLAGEKKNTAVAGELNGFVNANLAGNPGRLKAVKEFVKFMNSDEKILDFVNICSYNRALKTPDISEDSAEYKALTPFAQSMFNVRKNWDIVYAFSNNTTWIKNSGMITAFNLKGWVFNGGTTHTNPLTWCNNNKSVPVKAYFDKMYETKQNDWRNKL